MRRVNKDPKVNEFCEHCGLVRYWLEDQQYPLWKHKGRGDEVGRPDCKRVWPEGWRPELKALLT